MSSEEAEQPTEGAGYAVATLGGLGEGYGFRTIRSRLGVPEVGVTALVIPAGIESGFHMHERQQELYFVHRGTIEIEFGDGSKHKLEEGGAARVDASTARKVRNVSDTDDAAYLVVGADGGYVGRDGKLAEGEESRFPDGDPNG